MAYNELIKHFDMIRDYIHEFYIYGFRNRDNIHKKSTRSYDNEKRRLESYLKDYMSFQYINSKSVFLSVDNRHIPHNPLYKAFQSKSFTDKSMILHFIILDILYDEYMQLTLKEIVRQVDDYLSLVETQLYFDESTIRKKLNEYERLGLIIQIKDNHQNKYQRNSSFHIQQYEDVLHFFSEINPLGVIGSYLLNRIEHHDYFRFKHHYISYSIDSEIIDSLFQAMRHKKSITLYQINPKTHKESSFNVVPLKIFISSQTGRAHLLSYNHHKQTITTSRIDYIKKIKQEDICPMFNEYRQKLTEIQKHIWSIQYIPYHLEHVEFTFEILPHEQYIYQRLLREKRIGTIFKVDDSHYCFQADVYDTYELIPWIRTYICRITELNFSNRTIENILKDDIKKMYQMYEIGDDE